MWKEQWKKGGKPGAAAKAPEPSGLGADGLPVPEPTVRDLSVPQGKPDNRAKKPAPERAKEPAPAEEGEVIPAREVAAATTADVLGRAAESPAKSPEAKEPKAAP